MANNADVPIGVHQSSVMKWATLFLTTTMTLLALRAFYLSNKGGFWLGFSMALFFYAITLFNTVLVSNISLTSKGILIENLFTHKVYGYDRYIKTISFIPGYSKVYLKDTSYVFRNQSNNFNTTSPSESFKNHERIMDHIRKSNTSIPNSTV